MQRNKSACSRTKNKEQRTFPICVLLRLWIKTHYLTVIRQQLTLLDIFCNFPINSVPLFQGILLPLSRQRMGNAEYLQKLDVNMKIIHTGNRFRFSSILMANDVLRSAVVFKVQLLFERICVKSKVSLRKSVTPKHTVLDLKEKHSTRFCQIFSPSSFQWYIESQIVLIVDGIFLIVSAPYFPIVIVYLALEICFSCKNVFYQSSLPFSLYSINAK